MLDAAIETTKALTPAPTKKVAEAAMAEAEAEAATAEAEAEAVPSVSVEMKPAATKEGAKQESLGFGITTEKEIAKEAKSPGHKALSENLDFIIRHASRKRLSEGEIAEANHYAQKLKYPKGPWCSCREWRLPRDSTGCQCRSLSLPRFPFGQSRSRKGGQSLVPVSYTHLFRPT